MSCHKPLLKAEGMIKCSDKTDFPNVVTKWIWKKNFILSWYVLIRPSNVLRKKFIKPYYFRKPSVFKLVQLLATQNVSELLGLGKFLFQALQNRDMFLL